MPTQQQIAQEKANEARLNQLSEQIIGYTGWGRFYPLMKAASQAGQGLIPHQVCVSADGREVTVYKSDTGKIIGAFLKPTHEYVTKYVSQGDYGMAIASIFGIAGQLKSFQDQQKATCITITPNEVMNLVASVPGYDTRTGLKTNLSNSGSGSGSSPSAPRSTSNAFYTQNSFVLPVAGITTLAGILLILKIGKLI